jgi:hypothetical protein
MRIVEVRSERVDFPKTLGAMREWLDQNGRPLVRFETEADGNTLLVKVRFDADELAESFRHSFRGSFEGGSPPIKTEAAKLGANPSD